MDTCVHGGDGCIGLTLPLLALARGPLTCGTAPCPALNTVGEDVDDVGRKVLVKKGPFEVSELA